MKKAIILTAVTSLAATIGVMSAAGAFTPRTARAVAHASKAASSHQTHTNGFGAGVVELAQKAGLNVATLHRFGTIGGANPAEIVGTARGASTCAYLSHGSAAAGGCMQLHGSLISPRVSIVDGATYAWGLAAANVSSVSAQVDGQQANGTVSNGIFSVSLPDGTHGTGPISLSVGAGNATTTVTLPGIPKPIAGS